MNKKNDLKKIILLGFPLLLSRLSHYFHTVADSMMMGHYKDGSSELAAIAVAGLFMWIIYTLLWPLGSGVQALTTRKEGEESLKDDKELNHIGQILDNGVITSLLVGFIALVISYSAKFIFPFLLKSVIVQDLAIQYVRIVRWSIIPFGFTMVLERFLGSVHKTTYVMIAGLITNGLNILLNYIFIFGKLGFRAMGIEGAALGTLISIVVSLIFLISVFIVDTDLKKYHIFLFNKIKTSTMWNIFKLSYPITIQNSAAFITLLIYESLVEGYGPIYLAAIHVVFSSFRINKTLVGGFAHAGSILSGNAIGANDKSRAKRIVKLNYVIGLLIGTIAFCLFFFFPRFISMAFSNDPATMNIIAEALRFFSIFYFFEIIGFSFEVIFVNVGWSKFILLSEFTTNILFIIAFSFIINWLFPGNYRLIWLGFGLYQIAHSAMLHFGYFSKRWLHIKI